MAGKGLEALPNEHAPQSTSFEKQAKDAAKWLVSVFGYRDRNPELFALSIAHLFARYDSAVVKEASQRIVYEHKFPPSLSEIKERLDGISENQKSRQELQKYGPCVIYDEAHLRQQIEGPKQIGKFLPKISRTGEV